MIIYEDDLVINHDKLKLVKNNSCNLIKYNYSNILWDDLIMISNFSKLKYINFLSDNNKKEIQFCNDNLKNNLFNILNLFFPDKIKKRFKFIINHDENGILKTKTTLLGSKKNQFKNTLINNIESLKKILFSKNELKKLQVRVIFKPTIYFYENNNIEYVGINLICNNLEIKNELSYYRSDIEKNIFKTKIVNSNNINKDDKHTNIFKIKI